MKKAMVTLVIGKKFGQMFKKWFYPDWEAYAKKFGFDVLVIDRMIDTTERAIKRSPAWQKCILHRNPVVCKYDQIAWVDADIRINREAPNIFDYSPNNKISAVDDYGTPSREEHDLLLSRLYAQWDTEGVKYIRNLTPPEYHGVYGLNSKHNNVVQTGVMVFSPTISRDLFERVYNNYEERGDSSWNYEMRPLSYEILQSGLVNWLNPRFNMVWPLLAQLHYPFLNTSQFDRKIRKFFPFLNRIGPRADCVLSAFANSYFLHFAGSSPDYTLIPLQKAVN